MMLHFNLKKLESEARIENKIAKIYGAVHLVKLSEHSSLKDSDLVGMSSVLEYGYVATIHLEDYETIVPNGKNTLDRRGYYYHDAPFTEPMHTLSEWTEACSDDKKPHLLVNANWFNIWESGVPEHGNKINPRTFSRTFLAGLAVSNGEIVSEHTALDQGHVALDSLLINKKSGTATILSNHDILILEQKNKLSLKNTDAVSGFLILKNGIYVPSPDKNNHTHDLGPRTGIGISENGKTLYIIVIQPGIPKKGITAKEFAIIFKKLGAKEVINFDNNGSSELLYRGTDELGKPIKIQTQTSDKKADGTRDSERPKPNYIGFYPRQKQKPKGRDDSYLFFAEKILCSEKKSSSKDDLELIKNAQDLLHDSYFNNRRKTVYESLLAQLLMHYSILFNSIISKVSNLIVHDLIRVIGDKSTSTSATMRDYFCQDYDLNILFGPSKPDVNKFFEKLISTLQNKDSDNFYQQMCIQRAYITFFMEKGKAKPSLQIAKDENWIPKCVDLDKMLFDISRWRDGLFIGNRRNSRGFTDRQEKIRPSIFKLTSKNIGVIPGDEYKFLSALEQKKLMDKLPLHKRGMQEYYITTHGIFADSGMHRFDMPQLCGPSGMTAMRLALANQANLSQNEKELYAFSVGMYHVAIGAHSIDECFCIADKGEFNHYQRGDYESILPKILMVTPKFKHFSDDIKQLNAEYADLFHHKNSSQDYISRSDIERAHII